ncbi:MAG TPA: hypothetical protein VGM37_00475 [Armatimonadota bacterium]|jgi:hypothetical protein
MQYQFARCRRGGALAFASALALGIGGGSRAGRIAVSVSNVTVLQNSVYVGQPITVGYTLAGSGINVGGIASVKVEIMNGTTVAKTVTFTPPTGTLRGANSVSVDTSGVPPAAAYSVRVTAVTAKSSITGPNGTDYYQISDSTDPALQFVNPRGVDVNRNAASPYFGRVYVTEGRSGIAPGRVTTKGVYILDADLAETFPGAEPKARDSGVNGGAWTASANSPFRVTVGPDDQVYITDWSDPHSGLFIADPDVNTVQDLFIFPFPPGGQRGTSRGTGDVIDANGAQVYSSISSVWVEGTGAARKVFTADYYGEPMGSIFEYDIPGGQVQWVKPPDKTAVSNNGSINTDSEHDVVRDSAGNFYVANITTSDQAVKFDKDGAVVTQIPAIGTGYFGIAIDDARNKIALSTNDGRIIFTDKSFAAATPAITTGSSGEVRDVAFDADGWVYAVDLTAEALFVYAPPGTYPVSGGQAVSTQTVAISRIPLPGDIAPVGPSGLYVGPNGHRYGDDKVDLQDIVLATRVYAGLATLP